MLRLMSASVAVTLIVCVVFVHGRNLQDPASIADDDSNDCSGLESEDDQTVGCCGNERYNKTSQICCSRRSDEAPSHLIDAAFGEHSSCCGVLVYDGRVDGCCDGFPYNLAAQLCCGGTIIRGRVHGEQTACCGLQMYNDAEQVCCSGDVVRPRISGDAAANCCDGPDCCVDPETGAATTFNAEEQLCCDGAIHDRKTSNSMCCGTAAFDNGTHVCCADGSVGVGCCGASTVEFGWDCCGGSKAYSMASELCCDEVVRRKVFDVATECCGTAVYNSSSSICCDGAVLCAPAAADEFRC